MSGGTRSFETASLLAKWGHEVQVVTGGGQESHRRGWRSSNESGAEVHWHGARYSQEMGYARRVGIFLRFALASFFRGLRIEADVVFASSTPLTIALPAVLLARIKRVPLVFEVRDLWPAAPIAVGALRGVVAISLAKWLEKFAYANSTAVIVLSPEMKAGVLSVGYDSSRVAVIPNACDFDLFDVSERVIDQFFDSRPHLLNRPFILYAGTFGLVNDLRYAVTVANFLDSLDSNVAILLVGDGSEKETVMRLAEDLHLLDRRIFFEERKSKIEIAQFFAAATAVATFVKPLPLLGGNSANKFFDGLAAGKPVVVNADGWMVSLTREFECGLLLSNPATDRTAREIHKRLNDPVWLSQTGQNARRLGARHFDREELVQKVENVLQFATGLIDTDPENIAPGVYRAANN